MAATRKVGISTCALLIALAFNTPATARRPSVAAGADAVAANPGSMPNGPAAGAGPAALPAPSACTDFDAHVNGSWAASTVLPADRSRIGSFDTLRQANDRLLEAALGELVVDAARSRTPGLALLRAYYRSGMDLPAIERRGLSALQPLLERLTAAKAADLPALIGELARLQVAAPFALQIGTDARDATRHVLQLNQGGLGLPDREDYFRDEENSRRLRAAYRLYATRLLEAAGAPADAATVDALLDFETRLAGASLTRAQRRDPLAAYNPHTPASLQSLAPGLPWQALLDAYARRTTVLWAAPAAQILQAVPASAASPAAPASPAVAALPAVPATPTVTAEPTSPVTAAWPADSTVSAAPQATEAPMTPPIERLIVGQPAFAQAAAALVAEAPPAVWATYLRVRLLDATAPHLPAALARAHFDYHRAAIRGLKSPPPRDETVIQSIGGPYGNAPLALTLGELYIDKAYSPLARQRAQQMLADIRSAMHGRIDTLPWMSEPTRVLARAKLDAMVAKIGAPTQFPLYPGLALQADDYAGNLLRVNAWHTAERLAALAQPVDRERWTTSPHIVNAFAAGGNQIVFPAGILQPPFFDAAADDASNYGGIGMVIGHEITHHFDDRGRQFDAVGNLRDWWQPADAAAYRSRAERVAAMYAVHEPLPGVRIDGRLTLGENISDIAGVQLAYDGLQIALARQGVAGTPAADIDGQTPAQRFFTANALIWRNKMRPEALTDLLRTDSHSPGRWRVLVPLAQTPAFAQAFGCKPGDPMVASEPVLIW